MANETDGSLPTAFSVERLGDCTDSRHAYVESLWVRSFPESERRETAEQRALVQTEPRFALWALCCDRVPVGLLTTWNFGGFVFMEHLAIDPARQSQGIGRRAIDWAAETMARPLVLEVELPNDTPSRRRIAFYERLGFRAFSQAYEQPPYRAGGPFVAMRLLYLAPGGLAGLEFDAVRATLYREVYRCADA